MTPGTATEDRAPRIAFLLSSLKFGGGERVALNLAAALKARGYRIDFVVMRCEGEYLQEARRLFNVVDLRCERTWKLPLRLGRYLRRVRPAGLISSFWKLNLCACAAKAFQPSVRLALWEHSPPSRSRNSPAWLYAPTASLFYRMGTAVIAVSSGVASDVLRITWGLRNRLQIIWNPIPAPAPGDFAAAGHASKRIVWVGRLARPKNPGLMVEAFALLPKGAGYSLEFVGDGDLRSALEQRVQDLALEGSVQFLGFQPAPYPFMQRADLLVLSSDSEGFGNVLVEALYAGLRAVSTDCGAGVHDILVEHRYGTIVPTNSAPALAAAIQQELAAPYDRQVQAAAARRFEPDAIAGQFLQALRLTPDGGP